MTNKQVKLKNKRGDYLYPYTDNIPIGSASEAGKVKVDSAPTSGSTNAISSGAVHTALAGKLGTTDTAAKATADAEGNNIASTYLKKTEEGKGGLNLLSNQLLKAFAWTWSQTLQSGTVFIVYKQTGEMTNGVACTSYSSDPGYPGNCVIDGKLYSINQSTGALTQLSNDTDFTFAGYGNAIKGGKLYSFFKNAYTSTETGWTKISNFFGIRNGALYTFNNQSTLICTCLDSGGVWTDINSGYNDSGYCAGIRDGYPYFVSRKNASSAFALDTIVKLDTENGYSMMSADSSYYYFAKGSKYKCFYSNRATPYYAADLQETIVELYNRYARTSSGKVYQISSNNPTLLTEGAIKLNRWGYIKADGLYTYAGNKIVSGSFSNSVGTMVYSGAGTVQSKTVYSVGNPDTNYLSFERLDLSNPATITATTPTTITSNSKTYTRDISMDSIFTQPPDDLKKQSPTKWELLDMISNLN